MTKCSKNTDKILLVITKTFFERVFKHLTESKIMDTLEKRHASREIDVVTIFAEDILLDQTKHGNLLKFENIDASLPGFDWNCLRMILIRNMPTQKTERPAGLFIFISYLVIL